MDRDLESIQQMREAVQQAKQAQAVFLEYSQDEVDHIVKQVAEAAFQASESLGEQAVQETGMGVIEHKKMKNELSSMGVYESIKDEKTVGIIQEDSKSKITKIAYPFGVIACIIPTTNPTATALFKVLIALKTRNAIVVSPHPSAVKCTTEALKICEQAAVSAGAPKGLLGYITKPTMEATNQLMKHPDIELILATGGSGLVKAAYSSGKPAYGVGPGNVPVYVDKAANVKNAIKMIVDSKTFDNGTICATEQGLIVHQHIKELAIRELKNNGAYFLDTTEKANVENVISPTRKGLNPAIVGRSAEKIAEMAGLHVPEGTRLLIAEEEQIGKDIPFSIEKLAPIFPFYTAGDREEAKQMCVQLLDIGGRGHSLSLHTNDKAVTRAFGMEMPVSRVLVNTLASIGAAGATTELMPSMTLGCGGYGGNITADNITAHHLINIKRVAHGSKEVEVPESSSNDTTDRSDHTDDGHVEEIVAKVLENGKTETNAIDPTTVSEMVHRVLKNYQ